MSGAPLPELRAQLQGSSIKAQLAALDALSEQLQRDAGSITGHADWSGLVTDLCGTLSANNAKVCALALDCLRHISAEKGEALWQLHGIVLPPLVERLGDAKPAVRASASGLLDAMPEHLGAGSALDRLNVAAALRHKNASVREGLLLCLSRWLARDDAQPIPARLAPAALSCLEDSSPQVRRAAEAACAALAHADPQQLGAADALHLRPSALRFLRQASPEAALCTPGSSAPGTPSALSSAGASAAAPSAEGSAKPALSGSSGARRARTRRASPAVSPSPRGPPASPGAAPSAMHGLTAEEREALLLPMPPPDDGEAPTALRGEREVAPACGAHCAALSAALSPDGDWQDRVRALRGLQSLARACLEAGPAHSAALCASLGAAAAPLCAAIGDLRSAVAREACRALCALCSAAAPALPLPASSPYPQLLEAAVPALLSAGTTGAKVVAIAAEVAARYLVGAARAEQPPRLLAALCLEASRPRAASAPFARRLAMGAVAAALLLWDDACVEEALAAEHLSAALRSGLQDSDAEVRSTARHAYWCLHGRNASAADVILCDLPPPAQRSVQRSAAQLPSPRGIAHGDASAIALLCGFSPPPSPPPRARRPLPSPPAPAAKEDRAAARRRAARERRRALRSFAARANAADDVRVAGPSRVHRAAPPPEPREARVDRILGAQRVPSPPSARRRRRAAARSPRRRA